MTEQPTNDEKHHQETSQSQSDSCSSDKKQQGGFWSFWRKLFGKPAQETGEKLQEVGDQASNAFMGLTGKAMHTMGETFQAMGSMAGKMASSTGELLSLGLSTLTNSIINTTKFLTSSQYRRTEAYPWLRAVLTDNWKKVSQEIDESQDMLLVLWKYSRGYPLSPEEKTQAKEQLYDVIRVVPALAIFALPGGAILLPLLARALPWELMPSSFQQKVKEEFGEDSLKSELDPDEEIPLDKEASIPEDVKQEVESKLKEALKQQSEVPDEVAEEINITQLEQEEVPSPIEEDPKNPPPSA